jgi:hypothetical protein
MPTIAPRLTGTTIALRLTGTSIALKFSGTPIAPNLTGTPIAPKLTGTPITPRLTGPYSHSQALLGSVMEAQLESVLALFLLLLILALRFQTEFGNNNLTITYFNITTKGIKRNT